MSLVSALPDVVGLDEWDARRDDGRSWELVRGVSVVSPRESHRNTAAAVRLCRLLEGAFGGDWKALPQVEIDLGAAQGRSTVRVPDVVLLSRDADPGAHRALPVQVALVVEIVSPSSVEVDWLVKRDEYARARIPAYLVIDPRGEAPRMALFDRIVDGRYAEPHGDGGRATLRVGGCEVEIVLDDLLIW